MAMDDSSDESDGLEPTSHLPFAEAFAGRRALREVSWFYVCANLWCGFVLRVNLGGMEFEGMCSGLICGMTLVINHSGRLFDNQLQPSIKDLTANREAVLRFFFILLLGLNFLNKL